MNLLPGAGAVMVFNNSQKEITMNKKHYIIVAVLFLTLQITASPLSELLKQMNATEELVTTPISVRAIIYSYDLFKTRIIDDLKNELNKKSSEEKLEDINCYFKIAKNDVYFIWALGNGVFQELQKKYNNDELVLVNVQSVLDEDGLFVRYLEGFGIHRDDKIEIISVIDGCLRSPIVTTSLEIDQTIKNNELLRKWNKLTSSESLYDNNIVFNKYSDCHVLDKTVYQIHDTKFIGVVSLPFIQYASSYFRDQLFACLYSLADEIRDRNSINSLEELEKKMTLSDSNFPFGMSKIEWGFITENPTKLSYYERTIRTPERTLIKENGFMIKLSNGHTRKIPSNIEVFSYEED